MHLPLTSIVVAAIAIIGSASAAPQGKMFNNFLQIWLENQDFNTVANTPEFKSLQSQGILLNNYNAITHPSEPNYVAAGGASNYGVVLDLLYNLPANIPTIYDLLEKKGLTWKVYQEGIPYPGFTGVEAGLYVRKHNPAIIFDSVALNATRAQNIVGDDQFQADVSSGNLPNWMFYTPNLLNDGHNTNASYAGNWLAGFYEKTLGNPNLLNNALILITFDEAGSYVARNRVWSLLLGAIPENLKGSTDNTFYTHFSAISTVEHNWDLGNLGQQDTKAKVSNVYQFAAEALNYTNVKVPALLTPLNILPIPGLMTGKSYNETHLFSGL